MAKILIFEDNMPLANYWRQLLELENHDVRCCSTVQTAIEYVTSFVPDLLIVDMLIKHTDPNKYEGGLLLIAKLKLDNLFSGPILGVSGFRRGPYVHATALDAAQSMGISMALYKPILPTQLVGSVEQLLK